MAENQAPHTRKRSLPHTRAGQGDRSKRANGVPPDEVIIDRMEAAIHPAVYAQVDIDYGMGLRVRILTLPVMVAFMLGLIWRQLGSVREAVRAEARQRSLPRAVAWARQHFHSLWALDGSTLDGLLRKWGLLRAGEGPVLGGRIGTLLAGVTPLPRPLWYEEGSQPMVRAVITAGCWLLLDKGLIDFALFDQLSERQVGFLTRPKRHTRMQVRRVLSRTATVHDSLIALGSAQKQCAHPLRLVKGLFRSKWYAYLTNVLDPTLLPAECVVALYDQRWRIEDAFNVVKRLLGMACCHTSSLTGLQLPVWATWLLYALLVDLTDAVAEALHRPFKDGSLEMVFRGLYHFTQARHNGRADDPIEYSARNPQDLALSKAQRQKKRLSWIEQMELTLPPTAYLVSNTVTVGNKPVQYRRSIEQ